MLDKLTPSTLGVALIRIPKRDQKKEPFRNLSQLVIGNEHFGVDLDHSDDDIYKTSLFELPGVSSRPARAKLDANVRGQLAKLREFPVRDRSTKDGLPMLAAALTAWDLFSIKKVVAFAQYITKGEKRPDSSTLESAAIGIVAEELWPAEYAQNKKAPRERARHHIEYAQKEIDALIA